MTHQPLKKSDDLSVSLWHTENVKHTTLSVLVTNCNRHFLWVLNPDRYGFAMERNMGFQWQKYENDIWKSQVCRKWNFKIGSFGIPSITIFTNVQGFVCFIYLILQPVIRKSQRAIDVICRYTFSQQLMFAGIILADYV